MVCTRLRKSGIRRNAFTLVELLVVLAVLSILFFVITPRFISVSNPAKTKTFLARLQNSLQYLSDKSVLEKKVYFFNLDLANRRYFFTVSEEGNPEGVVRDRYLTAVSFPEHLEVSSVRTIPGDEVREGTVMLPFTPTGMLYSFEISFRVERMGDFVLRANNLSNRIQVARKTEEGDRALY